ncbi:MAG: hypothetical protein ABR548_13455 [Actinomycetota bacterium]|nr:hypothetical protein [Actinomycetota bacterium]
MEPGVLIERSLEEQEAFALAARESMRRQIMELLKSRGLLGSSDLLICPRCGDRTIILSQQATWVKDKASKNRLCAPCGTEIAVASIMGTSDEIGGEG